MSCKLELSEREKHAEAYRLHRDLLSLRREDPVFAAQRKAAWMARCWAMKHLCCDFSGRMKAAARIGSWLST